MRFMVPWGLGLWCRQCELFYWFMSRKCIISYSKNPLLDSYNRHQAINSDFNDKDGVYGLYGEYASFHLKIF